MAIATATLHHPRHPFVLIHLNTAFPGDLRYHALVPVIRSLTLQLVWRSGYLLLKHDGCSSCLLSRSAHGQYWLLVWRSPYLGAASQQCAMTLTLRVSNAIWPYQTIEQSVPCRNVALPL